MPPYPGLRHCMELSIGVSSDGSKTSKSKQETIADEDDWAAQYQAYLDEKDACINQQEEAEIQKEERVLKGEDWDWAVQYAEYCIEKENEFFEFNRSSNT